VLPCASSHAYRHGSCRPHVWMEPGPADGSLPAVFGHGCPDPRDDGWKGVPCLATLLPRGQPWHPQQPADRGLFVGFVRSSGPKSVRLCPVPTSENPLPPHHVQELDGAVDSAEDKVLWAPSHAPGRRQPSSSRLCEESIRCLGTEDLSPLGC
jgi:hypothetical protein